ncbi:hypothetical protein Anapl_16811 [Anas platyrhynchos]|uniref:Uncharacterized protein n=1 Tax=Anas platyrhynchos TaxID=8839 RepID=R0LS08_ANAPL|nr:hypothetical protein Anapl_16811 [Anas platyrhynchos]
MDLQTSLLGEKISTAADLPATFQKVGSDSLTHSSHLSQILAAMGPCVQLCCNFLPPYDSGSNMVIGERCQVIWYDIGIQCTETLVEKSNLVSICTRFAQQYMTTQSVNQERSSLRQSRCSAVWHSFHSLKFPYSITQALNLVKANRSEKLIQKVAGNRRTRAGEKLELREADLRTQLPLAAKQLRIMGNHTSLETRTVLITLQLILLVNNRTVYDSET